MTDYGTIKIPRDEYERHNERREELGVTWSEYIDGAAPQHDVPDVDEIAATLEASMDGVAVDESAIATMVVEDLRASLPREIAEELR